MDPAAAKTNPITREIEQALALVRRGSDELLVESEFAQQLARAHASGQPLRCKLGLDPTARHSPRSSTVVLNKLRQLQDLGHTVIFLIGDFTALIGTSGRNTMRPPLSRDEIRTNAKTYFEQAALVLDRERTEIRYNSSGRNPSAPRE
jgi:tyrosyl-tRNA synthetase